MMSLVLSVCVLFVATSVLVVCKDRTQDQCERHYSGWHECVWQVSAEHPERGNCMETKDTCTRGQAK